MPEGFRNGQQLQGHIVNREKVRWCLKDLKMGGVAGRSCPPIRFPCFYGIDFPRWICFGEEKGCLSRLKTADETITKTDGNLVSHSLTFNYDMRSELTYAEMTNVGAYQWVSDTYAYDKAGNVQQHKYETSAPSSATTNYGFVGDLMDSASGGDNFNLEWDWNGNLTKKDETADTNLIYNWDNKLRSAAYGPNTISIKYDPMGNRVIKNSSAIGNRKYIIDISGGLPTILLEVNSVNGNIMKTYIYANSEILAQHDGNTAAPRYFYLHDRLGSVRQVTNTNASVVKYYTFDAFGRTIEESGTLNNSFMFTGQFYDSEIGQYYLRARQYDPQLMRFTAKDPLAGENTEPLSLHKYLYCQNEPINRIDLMGLWYEFIHQSFGNYGKGFGDLFDYASLDREKSPYFYPFYTVLHFKSKREAMYDIARAISSGDPKAFEYAVHEWQDTYTHYDKGYRWRKGHPDDPKIDDMDWSDPSDFAAYQDCDRMTKFFENEFFKCNIDFWMEHSQAKLSKSNPWLSIVDPSGPPSIGRRYLDPILKQQLGEE